MMPNLQKKILKNEYEKTKEKVFDELNNIIQASSIVENINFGMLLNF